MKIPPKKPVGLRLSIWWHQTRLHWLWIAVSVGALMVLHATLCLFLGHRMRNVEHGPAMAKWTGSLTFRVCARCSWSPMSQGIPFDEQPGTIAHRKKLAEDGR